MNQTFKVTVDLIPDVKRDDKTGLFVARFLDLPNTIAYDESEEKAILRLISIFEVVLKEQKELIFERIIRKHFEQALKEKSNFNFVRIQGVNNESEKMKLQMFS